MSYQTYHHNRNYGCRISEPTLRGYRCVSLENEKLRVTVLADKGADIYEFLYKPRDIDFMWRTWVGLRERSHFVPTSSRAGSGAHMDFYEGGWQELFPNCGNLSLHQELDFIQTVNKWHEHYKDEKFGKDHKPVTVRTIKMKEKTANELRYSSKFNRSLEFMRELRAEGQEVAVIAPDTEQVWEALRALYLVGQLEDLPAVTAYERDLPDVPERVREQAVLTEKAIRERAK